MANPDPRQDFPLLAKAGVAYLDNAATTQKPRAVLDAERKFYEESNANVHRGIHKLAEAATSAYENSRAAIAKRFKASPEELVFTSGTTHAMNLAARILEQLVRPGDEVLCTVADHHSTFVPFQQLAKRRGAVFVVVPLDTDKTITEKHISSYVTDKTRIIAIATASNVLGYSLDVSKIKKRKAVLVADAAQALAHGDLPTLKSADMVAVSAHKAYGPMGMGCLAAKHKLLEQGSPLLYGGSMIGHVNVQDTTWAEPPSRYEAGTPNVAGAVAFAAALDYLDSHRKEAEKREKALTEKTIAIVKKYATIIGPQKKTAPIVSFVVPNVHAHDVAQILDGFGVAVRAGQHCCEPLHDVLGISASVRVSLALYNNDADVEKLETGLKRVREVFR